MIKNFYTGKNLAQLLIHSSMFSVNGSYEKFLNLKMPINIKILTKMKDIILIVNKLKLSLYTIKAIVQ